MIRYRNVLLATDFSAAARAAADHAEALASSTGATLHLLHVIEEFSYWESFALQHFPSPEIIEELAPLPHEILLSKSCSGVFAGTNLDFLLRRLGVTSLIVGGVVTNGCVEHAVIHGHDLGYACVLVADGCGALTDEIHENALERLEHRRAHVLTTDAILSMTQVDATAQAAAARS